MAQVIKQFLLKMSNEDPDFRYMAASDLLNEFKAKPEMQIDPDWQKKLLEGISKLLEDSSSEVQGLALKCLPPLFCRLDRKAAELLINQLLDFALKSSRAPSKSSSIDVTIGLKSMRDVASLGLKSILSETDPQSDAARAISVRMLPRLEDAIRSSREENQIEALELLNEVLVSVGASVAPHHESISTTVLPILESKRPIMRKRAINCLSSLSMVCNDQLFDKTASTLIKMLQSARAAEKNKIRTGVQALWYLAKASGFRLGPHIPTVVPLLFGCCTAEEHVEDDELREHCIQTLASFVYSCSRDMVPYRGKLVEIVIELASFDPNYADTDGDEDDDLSGEDEKEMDVDEADAGEDYSDEEEYSDEDDMSWKVRRAVIKCVHVMIKVQLLPINDLYALLGVLLISRFKEREETVKLDVFSAFKLLLCISSTPSAQSVDDEDNDAMAVDTGGERSSIVSLLSTRVKQIVRALKREVASKSVKTRIGVMSLLVEFIKLAPNVLAPFLQKFGSDLDKGLADSSAQMKAETISFIRNIIERCNTSVTCHVVERLVPRILVTANDRYYKVTAESLALCCSVVKTFGANSVKVSSIASIFEASLSRLKARDQDSEVKEAALECVSLCLAYYGNEIGQDKISAAPPVIIDRLNNEVTRLASVRALRVVAESRNSTYLNPHIETISSILSGFLRKSFRPLRLECLELLSLIAETLPRSIDEDLFNSLAGLIDVGDLRLSTRALKLCNALIQKRGDSVVPLVGRPNGVFSKLVAMVRSPLLQGPALGDVLNVLQSLARISCEPLTVSSMLKDLRLTAASLSSKSALRSSSRNMPIHAIAKCVSVLCSVTTEDMRESTASSFIEEMNAADFGTRVFAMACLGELGRTSQLSVSEEVKKQSHLSILKAMDAPEEVVQIAAAVAYGAITAGNNANEVPGLISLIQRRPENRYLLLLSLKEVIEFADVANVMIYVPLLLPTFLQGGFGSSDKNGEESIKTATAECLGLLAQVDPEMVVPALKDGTCSESAAMRGLTLAAVKFGVSAGRRDTHKAFEPSLRAHLGAFLNLLSDSDVSVRKNCLQAVHGIARSRPRLLRSHLRETLPKIYSQTVKNSELVRMVDLGPFRYEEDDGLDLRKSAFETMRTLLTGPLASAVPHDSFMEVLVRGLRDHADVRALAQLILSSIASSPFTVSIVASIEEIVNALTATLKEKIRENAVRQEVERHEDSIRSALRAACTLEKVPEIAAHPVFASFLTKTVRSGSLMEQYTRIRGETVLTSSAPGPITGSFMSGRRAHGDAMEL